MTLSHFDRLASRSCLSQRKRRSAARKFLQFDIKFNVLRENKTKKAFALVIVCCSEFVRL